MKIGPKYKIARRLGAPIFEKTQTAKFQASKERKSGRIIRPRSSFGAQMVEKQKTRLTYGVTEKQLKNYANKALQNKTSQTDALYGTLESRLDNVVYRAGFAETRRKARQLVSHGHIIVNNIRVTIPSYQTSKDEVISIRKESVEKPVFRNIEEALKNKEKVDWLTVDIKKKEVKVTAKPAYKPIQELFDLNAVFEYYRR